MNSDSSIEGFGLLLSASQEAHLYDGGIDDLLSMADDQYVELDYDSTQKPKIEHVNYSYCDYDANPVMTQGTQGSYQASATGKLPSLEPFPGIFNFALDMKALESEKGWSYSTKLNKVFINISNRFPVSFKWRETLEELYVRSMMVYRHPNDFHLAVQRCQIHLPPNERTNKGFVHTQHVIRAEHPSAEYHLNPESERLSVTVPLDQIQPGATSVTVFYTFVCKNSCLGGMNRRQTRIVFTLEDVHGQVHGRQIMDIRVCSCPKRDKDKEEADVQKNRDEPDNRKRPMTKTNSTSKKVKKSTSNEQTTDSLEFVDDDAYQQALQFSYNYLVGRASKEGRSLSEKEEELKEKYKAKML